MKRYNPVSRYDLYQSELTAQRMPPHNGSGWDASREYEHVAARQQERTTGAIMAEDTNGEYYRCADVDALAFTEEEKDLVRHLSEQIHYFWGFFSDRDEKALESLKKKVLGEKEVGDE